MKKIFSLLLTVSVISPFSGGCSAQDTAATTPSSDIITDTEIILTIGQPNMLINGFEQSIDENGTVPIIINDRTLLPVRAVVEAMGGSVEWNGDSQTVTLTRNNDVIRLIINSTESYFNDTPYTLDTAPVIINDRTMLPIRFIAENFGFDVEWDAERQRVIITELTESIPSQEAVESTMAPAVSPSQSQDEEGNTNQENYTGTITVTVNGTDFKATLEDNETARAFYEMLPLTLEMDELNGNEKYYYLDENLPSSSENVDMIRTGDLMLYGANCLVSFFETFETSYTYTRIGHIDDAEGYASSLPNGSVTITFTK